MTLTTDDLDTIQRRIEDGLTDAELAQIAQTLKDSNDTHIMWRCLHVLGWSRATEYRSLIEGYLCGCRDINIKSLAFKILLQWFPGQKRYLGILKYYISKNIGDDDSDNDMILEAVFAAGPLFGDTKDLEILRRILHFTEVDRSAFSESAFDALAYALEPDFRNITAAQRYALRSADKRSENVERAVGLLSNIS